jgi:hypothetical protein
MYLLLHLFMAKEMQTLKLNPELIKDLKRTAKKKKVSFNSYCESILLVHHFTNGDTAKIFNQLRPSDFHRSQRRLRDSENM